MIEEDLERIEKKLELLWDDVIKIKSAVIPEIELNDSQKESNESFDAKMDGDEPRKFKKCRVCRKKPCVCEVKGNGKETY